MVENPFATTLPFNADSRLHNRTWRFGSFGCKVCENHRLFLPIFQLRIYLFLGFLKFQLGVPLF